MLLELFECSWCHEAKVRSEFYTYKSGRKYAHCKKCHNARSVANAANLAPEVLRARQRRYNEGRPEGYQAEANLKYRYGLTTAERDAMVESQQGLCALCNRPEAESRGGRLCVDHCHNSNRVRAMLCSECNVGLGKFSDNPEVLRAAADYIERHRDATT